MTRRIGIFYFSGTGNTAHVTKRLSAELGAAGSQVETISMAEILKQNTAIDVNRYDSIGLGHPIHSFGAPRIVHQFIRMLPRVKDKAVFLFKTAGSRGVLNDGASGKLITALARKGYQVSYDRAFIMPSNWAFSYPANYNKQLCNVVALKAKNMAHQLCRGDHRRIPCSPALAAVARILWHCEDIGARLYGKDLHADKRCTRCGKCVRECPSGNITVNNGSISFGWRCLWCLCCVYSCPARAITPRLMKFTVLKGGYNLERLVANPSLKGECVTAESKGFYGRQKDYFLDPSV
jgi:flavodoxin/ferredoxin